jgi:hypothetical protein
MTGKTGIACVPNGRHTKGKGGHMGLFGLTSKKEKRDPFVQFDIVVDNPLNHVEEEVDTTCSILKTNENTNYEKEVKAFFTRVDGIQFENEEDAVQEIIIEK